MKVLAMVGSPRKAGNSELLAKEMLASLPADVEKEMVRLTDLEIRLCKACYACLPAGKKCIINDDLDFVLSRIKAADAVIIASPCYFLGPHTIIKNIGDRLISVMKEGAEFAGKKCVTVTCYGVSDWAGYAKEAVNNFARFMHLDVVGDLLVNAAIPGEALTEDVKLAAKNLANKLLAPVQEQPLEGQCVVCTSCGSSMLHIFVDGRIRCIMCGTSGSLHTDSNGLSIQQNGQEGSRFSPEGMAEHGRLLEDIKQRYLDSRHEIAQQRRRYDEYDWWVNKN